MIDWLTLQFPGELLSPEVREVFQGKHGRIVCINADGTIAWETAKYESIRSDSHAVTVRLGSSLQILGSPARVGTKSRDNVFGSDDVVDCATRMIEFVSDHYAVQLPPVRSWRCTRLDITNNYFLRDRGNVRTVLRHLRGAEGGRYQVQTKAESVYWSTKSSYRSAKAYSKGEHLSYLQGRGQVKIPESDLQIAQGLLRLELSLKRHFFTRLTHKPWHALTAQELQNEHWKYFEKLVSKIEVKDMSRIEQRCIEAAQGLGLSEGRGRSAYMSWCVIRSEGFHNWQTRAARSTYHAHKRILLAAGLSWADLCAGNVIPLEFKRISIGQPVNSWAELRKIA